MRIVCLFCSGATNPYTEANYKPAFLSDDELKHLILRVCFNFQLRGITGCEYNSPQAKHQFCLVSWLKNVLIMEDNEEICKTTA